jgi:N,N'-diacetylchitobiose transport system permease protein
MGLTAFKATGRVARARPRGAGGLRRAGLYLAALVVSAFALFPIYWVVVTSLKPRDEIYTRTPHFWTSHPNWSQYPHVLGEGHVGRALLNSLIVAGSTMVVCLVVSALAAYALARLELPARGALLMLVLMTQMFPLVVLVIPLFVIMRKADLLGTYWGLVTAYLAFTVPLAIWVMRGFLITIPAELEHAARIDGATRLGAMWRVILPLAAPGLATTAVLCFLEGWKEFMLALTFINDENRKTLPLVLQSFVGRGDTDWGAIMATSVIYTLPVALVFLVLRKHLMTVRTAGALKG